jgi:ACS family hexuronate transporter-like MFS transporter
VFVACGGAGLVWAAWWGSAYRTPGYVAQTFRPAQSPRWTSLLALREVWGLVAAKFLTDAAWFFYISWLPKYLYDARHFDVKEVGAYAWLPYAASGVGCLLGGWLSSALIRRGRSIDFSRKCALGLSAAIMPAIVFVTRVPVDWALAIFSVAFFGQQSWSTLVMIVPTDLFDRRIVASVAGLVGFGGAMGGLLMNLAAGRLLDAGFTYGNVFAIVGTLHVIAFVVILVAIPRIQAIEGQT